MQWFFIALKNSFNFRSRARRKEFGWFNLGAFVISFTLAFFAGIMSPLGMTNAASVLQLIGNLFIIALIIPNLSVTARRLHDLGHSGWWQLIPILLNLLPMLISLLLLFSHTVEPQSLERTFLWVSVIGWIVLVIFLLYLLFAEGQRFTNRYGSDPKAADSSDDEPQAGTLPKSTQTNNDVTKQEF